jgi:hypothetical protein
MARKISQERRRFLVGAAATGTIAGLPASAKAVGTSDGLAQVFARYRVADALHSAKREAYDKALFAARAEIDRPAFVAVNLTHHEVALRIDAHADGDDEFTAAEVEALGRYSAALKSIEGRPHLCELRSQQEAASAALLKVEREIFDHPAETIPDVIAKLQFFRPAMFGGSEWDEQMVESVIADLHRLNR